MVMTSPGMYRSLNLQAISKGSPQKKKLMIDRFPAPDKIEK
ncbi:Unknown protein sequence [Pseudomonas savastanoi pv. phaseolicola]|nr:Unknown protein sequence [Pseudomonas savastanoi pv. phaseolicola]